MIRYFLLSFFLMLSSVRAAEKPNMDVFSDGCTGFPDRLFNYDWSACCTIHDAGGSDGALLDCITSHGPTWAAGLIAACVTLMVFFRPVYVWLQRIGLLPGLDNPNKCFCGANVPGNEGIHLYNCQYAIKNGLLNIRRLDE